MPLPQIINKSTFIVHICFLLCFTNAINAADETVRIIVTVDTLFTIPHEGNDVRFQCSDVGDVKGWMLPDEAEVTFDTAENATSNYMVGDKFNATRNYLDILGIEHGMDGRYVCILEDGTHRDFFIPHIVSSARLTKSVMISLSVTGIFCILCLIILTVDRYCFSDMDVIKAQVAQKSARKKNVSSATIAPLEFPV
uniref:Ig-like domain-containing protein n=1 Tax=Panagrellus redivivus TaxID=6233 RepID=A0A7E4UMH7_PANRE